MKTTCCNGGHAFSSINCRGKILDLSIPKIMGILNLTPDSFSDGGKFNDEKNALRQTEKLLRDGADIIDIGAQSTRPGSDYLTAPEEITRIGKVISIIKKEMPEALISVDTFHSQVVTFAYNEGMDLVNDISGGMYDPKMFETVAARGLPYILMHVNSSYSSMHDKSFNGDMLLALNSYFAGKIDKLQKAGIHDVILDPGFGFGKTVEQQHHLIDNLEHINFGEYPLLVGISRKSFIYKPLGLSPADVNGETQKLHLKMLGKGAKILRVHDVAEAKATVNLFMNR